MWRWSITVVALVVLVATTAGRDRPKVSLVLPDGIASETVQIQYYLTGAFGGSGSFVRPQKQRTSYDIDPFVEGRPAENIKIIAYLPGCEITTLNIAFSGTAVERSIDCSALGSVSLRGQVLPASLSTDQPREIEFNYLAMWAHEFFGIYDGPVTTIPLGSVRLDRDGRFEITVPDLYKKPILRDGGIQFILRDPETKNIVALLRPADTTPKTPPWLSVQASYPFVELVAQSNSQPAHSQ